MAITSRGLRRVLDHMTDDLTQDEIRCRLVPAPEPPDRIVIHLHAVVYLPEEITVVREAT